MRLYKKSDHVLKMANTIIVTQSLIDDLKQDKMYFDTFIKSEIKQMLDYKYIIIVGTRFNLRYIKFNDRDRFITACKPSLASSLRLTTKDMDILNKIN